MKLFSYLLKGFKYFLWLLLVTLLWLFVVGSFKYDGWVKDYFSYLNSRDWNDVWEKINWQNPFTWSALFWNEVSVWSWDKLEELGNESLEVEEFEISGMNSNDDSIFLDPQIDDEFDSYFEKEEELDEVLGSGDEDYVGEFWFLVETGIQKNIDKSENQSLFGRLLNKE